MLDRRGLVALAAAAALTSTSASLVTPAMADTPAQETTFDRIRRTKKLRTGGIASGAPYYQKDLTTGEWRGFYIDMCRSLAIEMEAELEIVETTWGNSVLDLQANKIDIFFGLNPTPKRALVIDFSAPVFNNAFTFMTKKGFAPKTWAEMNSPDVRISVDAGSSHDQVVSRLAPSAQITRLKTTDDATAALLAGRVDAQSIILMLALTALKKNPAIGQLLVPTPIFATTSNAGFRREPDKTWRDFVNTWIDFNKGLGYIRSTIISNMALVGITEADMPPGISL